MKILAIHTGNNEDQYIHAVDLWRVTRPMRELKKHVDWQIDERPTIMKHMEQYKEAKDFTEAELKKTVDDLKQYDIVFGSYTAFMNGMVYALCKMVSDKYGTKFIIDIDDDLFSINEDNVGWWRSMTHEKTHELQLIVRDNPYLTTTNEDLARKLRQRNPGKVFILPNYITEDYKAERPNNGDKVVIGYFGGASHFDDLNRTNAIQAIEKLMHEHKNVHFKSIGMPLVKYLPKARTSHVDGQRGKVWITDLIPSLQLDIAIAPLTKSIFNNSKSDIKWQESTLAGAAFIASNAPPYARTIKNGEDGILVGDDMSAWHNALEKLLDKKERDRLWTNANKRIREDFMIENKWQIYKEMFEAVCTDTL